MAGRNARSHILTGFSFHRNGEHFVHGDKALLDPEEAERLQKAFAPPGAPDPAVQRKMQAAERAVDDAERAVDEANSAVSDSEES